MISRNRIEKLKRIYRRIPKIQCKPGCHACCGPNYWLPVEAENIRLFLKRNNITERFAESHDAMCPYIEGDKCLIYPVRPVICRLFGVVLHQKGLANMECPHAKPDIYLTEEEADLMIEAVGRV